MMKTIFLAEFIVFYIFFFARAKILSKKIGISIKANDPILNVAILSAGLSAIFFMIEEYVKPAHDYLIVIIDDIRFDYIGLALISVGLIFSVLSSLNLGSSWRIGVNYSNTTELVTSGLYKISRNPYFTSYDVVLIGTMISSGSIVVASFSMLTIVLFHMLILKEEKYLEGIHNTKYLEYKKSVRRYF